MSDDGEDNIKEEKETKLSPPVAVGDMIEGQEVIGVGKKGEGTIKYEGYILFIEGTGEGDKGLIMDVKVDKVLPNFGIGHKIEEDE